VGLLIINSLLVLPAAAARNITGSVKSYTAAAVLLAMAAGISGLIGAYYANTAAGASIVLVSAVFFFITLALKSRMAR
jgi:zinc transport system permease protein